MQAKEYHENLYRVHNNNVRLANKYHHASKELDRKEYRSKSIE